jgi:hypothetical protein
MLTKKDVCEFIRSPVIYRRQWCWFYNKEGYSNIIKITIYYSFSFMNEEVDSSTSFYWSYTPPQGFSVKINICTLHVHKLAYIIPLLMICSTGIIYKKSILEIIKMDKENTPEKTLIEEGTHELYFDHENMKGSLHPIKSNLHINLYFTILPMGGNLPSITDSFLINKSYLFYFVPGNFIPISMGVLLREPYYNNSDILVSNALLKEIYFYLLSNMCVCEFGLGDATFLNRHQTEEIIKFQDDDPESLFDDYVTNNGSTDIPIITNMYLLDTEKVTGLEATYISPFLDYLDDYFPEGNVEDSNSI